MLTYDEEQRFDAWLRSQSEIATFFLDSYDELKLTLGSFEQALKRLNKALAGQLGRQVGLAAIQLHGAMGMTDECRAGHYAKRLIVINQLFGDATHHLARLADQSRP